MKKILSTILIFVMLLASVPVANAANSTESLAQDLKSLGIFQGVSDTEFDLNRAPTRVEALVMLIRLLGKNEAALSGEWSHPFSDVPGWADKYVGYAYENGLTNGISETEFGTGNATIQMYLTFVLRSLDYSDKGGEDFSYDNPYVLAYHTGILPDMVDRENFLRSDVVVISYCALSAYMKNTSDTLAQKLMAEDVFTQEDFDKFYDKTAIEYHQTEKKEFTAEEIYAKCSPAVFYVEVYDAQGQAFATGSGFFIDSDGTAITNYHVIDGAHSAKIKIGDTEEFYDVEGVYDCDEANDWAVIKVEGSGFDYLEKGDKSTVVGGATVYAMGSPLGLQNTISQGLISNVNRVLDGVSFIQTSAAISSGSSGGALINKYGEVIGITSAKFTDGENLGLALPIEVTESYDGTKVTPLSEITDSETAAPDEYLAEDVLRAFVLRFRNERIDDSIAYTKKEYTQNGYIEKSIVLNPDYSLEVLIWEKYNSDTYYFSIDLTGDERVLYYSYENRYKAMTFEAIREMQAEDFARDMKITFEEKKGNIKAESEEKIASEYVGTALDFVNVMFSEISKNYGFSLYTVADLGFVNFK